MLLTTAGLALARKIKDQHEQKREKRQGVLSMGDSDLAKKAFTNQTTKTIEEGKVGITRTGTDIKFEDPNSLDTPSSATRVTRTSQLDIASPVNSDRSSLAVTSPFSDVGDSVRYTRSASQRSTGPPPYSPCSGSATATPSVFSHDSDNRTLNTSDASSILSRDANAIKVRTKGSDLKSGFPYHPALFDLNVHPNMWDAFTHQVVETTKLTGGDTAKMWAAATATALTGAFVTAAVVGSSMKRSLQEKKIKAGMQSSSEDGLGETLSQWNDTYFKERGLVVILQMSESSQRRAESKKSGFRKPIGMFGSREERDSKREERKFVIVVTKLDDMIDKVIKGVDAKGGAVEMPAEGPAGMPELPTAQDAKYNVAELPADEGRMPIELAATELPFGLSLGCGNEKLAPPMGFAELDSDTTQLLDKTTLSDRQARGDTDGKLKSTCLTTPGSSQQLIMKEMT